MFNIINKILLYTMKHAMDKAAAFNSHTRAWERLNREIDTVEKYNSMIDDFKAQPINQLNPKDYIKVLADQEEIQLILAEGGEVDENGSAVAGSLTPAQKAKIGTKIEQKYSLSLLNDTFKNYFKTGENAYKLDERKIPKMKSGGTK